MSNIKNRRSEFDARNEQRDKDEELKIKQYFEQQAKDFENTLFKSRKIMLFKYMSERGLESIIAHAEEELKERGEDLEKKEKPKSGLLHSFLRGVLVSSVFFRNGMIFDSVLSRHGFRNRRKRTQKTP